jgi:NADPH2:quinone reductase
MTHAIRFHKTGGPEVLVWEEVQVGKPGPGEARIRHTAVGLNFVDIYSAARGRAWSRRLVLMWPI